MTVIHNNAWKSLLFSHIKIHPHICLEVFWTDFTSERSLICGYFSLDSDEMTFSLEKAILWIEDSHFSQKQRFKVKRVLMMDLFITNIWSFSLHMMLIDGLEWCGLLWCFYQLFGLSFWWHPFTAEDPLVSMQHFSKSDEETSSSTSQISVNLQQIFIFGWTIPLRSKNIWNGASSPTPFPS